MHAHLLGRTEHAGDECWLHHGFAAREGDTAMRRLEKIHIAFDFFDHGLVIDGLAVTHFPRIRILAILATQWATAHEDGHACSRTVDGRVDVPGMHEADITAFQRVDAVTPVQSDRRFEA